MIYNILLMLFSNNYLNRNNIILLFCSLLIISVKWIYSYSLYDEDIILRIINETGDNLYYPIIKSFSDFNLSPSFSTSYDNLRFISFPVLSLFINSVLFKFLNGYSFIVLELICVFVFLKIFVNILIELGVGFTRAFLFALILFSLNKILDTLSFLNLNLIEIVKLNFESFYTLRFPRPIIANLFLYSFVYFLIRFYKSTNNELKYFTILSVLMGISLNSFFYHAVNEFFMLIIVFFYKYRLKFLNIIGQNYKVIIISFTISLFFLSIFLIQINFSENDYSDRLGIFSVDNNQKLILAEYFKNFILKKEFIAVFIFNSLIFYFTKNSVLKIFYLISLSSLLSTIFIFLILNRGIDYYHFMNFIIIHNLLHLLLFIFFLFEKIYLSIHSKKLIYFSNSFLLILMISFIALYEIKNYSDKEKTNKQNRFNKAELTNFVKNNNLFDNKDLEIFNLNKDLSIWFIMNNFDNFSILPVSFWVSKKNDSLEDELYSTSKFFDLSSAEFNRLIKNEEAGWRYKNNFVYNFFGRRYLANNFTHYNNDYLDYTINEKKFIKKNNLLIAHQVIIPKSEIKRHINNFISSNKKITPEIIIVDKEEFDIFSKVPNSYCLIFENKKFTIYISNNLKEFCN